MNNLNWGGWLSGLISAFSNGCMIAIGALMVLKQRPAIWELCAIAIFPMLLQFFGYIRQNPPPIGKCTDGSEPK
jgi:uncharacterized membrane protein YedE/YeeE